MLAVAVEVERAAAVKAVGAVAVVPVAKVALLDKSFFGKDSHPARRLLDTMARAGIGWEPARTDVQDIIADAWRFLQANPDGYDD